MTRFRRSLCGCLFLGVISGLAPWMAWASSPAMAMHQQARRPAPHVDKSNKLHVALDEVYVHPGETHKVWVFFHDKGHREIAASQAAISELEKSYHPRAIKRRQLRRTRAGLFDASDLPVNPAYIRAVTSRGATKHVESKWLNSVSINAKRDQLDHIARLPFVKSIEPVHSPVTSRGR